jgi:hypothetical protein
LKEGEAFAVAEWGEAQVVEDQEVGVGEGSISFLPALARDAPRTGSTPVSCAIIPALAGGVVHT